MSKLGDCSDKPNELCPNVLQDFSRSERARLCETCEGLGHSCLGLNHPRLEDKTALKSLGFEELLSCKVPNYKKHLIPVCRMRCSGLVQQAVFEQDEDVALEAYYQAEAFPQTETERMLTNEFGYVLNKSTLYGIENLVICFKEAAPHVLKSLNEREYVRADSFF